MTAAARTAAAAIVTVIIMPREFPRSRRVEEAIQRILSETLAAKTRDPRLSSVIVTDVRVSRDLRVARVYVSQLTPDPAPAGLAAALKAATGFLRSTLARELRVRHVPELRFFPDEALTRATRLSELIGRAVAEDRAAHGGDDPNGAKSS